MEYVGKLNYDCDLREEVLVIDGRIEPELYEVVNLMHQVPIIMRVQLQ